MNPTTLIEELSGLNFQVHEEIRLNQRVAVREERHWSHCKETRLVKKLAYFTQDKVVVVLNKGRGFDIT